MGADDVLPPGSSAEVEKFLKDNGPIDPRVAEALRSASKAAQAAVLERGGLTDCRNPSGVLMSRIKNFGGLSSTGQSMAELQGDPAQIWARICAKEGIVNSEQKAQQQLAQHQQQYLLMQQQQQMAYLQQLQMMQFQQQQQAQQAALMMGMGQQQPGLGMMQGMGGMGGAMGAAGMTGMPGAAPLGLPQQVDLASPLPSVPGLAAPAPAQVGVNGSMPTPSMSSSALPSGLPAAADAGSAPAGLAGTMPGADLAGTSMMPPPMASTDGYGSAASLPVPPKAMPMQTPPLPLPQQGMGSSMAGGSMMPPPMMQPPAGMAGQWGAAGGIDSGKGMGRSAPY
eukprot:TRINITY_DN54241_c0_g1_i1.p1 TRINITY_DN54241_c0_g1~~TRINITY_DN54241_c0_g1_i1.p1  ORF type:complete len:339 (+),score=91.98 TRINITY_DN54241_c0_g1_i1:72-1088(+)